MSHRYGGRAQAIPQVSAASDPHPEGMPPSAPRASTRASCFHLARTSSHSVASLNANFRSVVLVLLFYQRTSAARKEACQNFERLFGPRWRVVVKSEKSQKIPAF